MYNLFDLAKFILSFLVGAIHLHPIKAISKNIDFYFNNTVCRLAVPLFFTISGFLLFNKLNKLEENNRKKQMSKYLKRIFIMYTIWSLIYFIPYVISTREHFSILKFIAHYLIDGPFIQLWYLQALLVAAFATFVCNHFLGIKKTMVVSTIFYMIGLMLVPYYPIFDGIIEKIPIISDLFNLDIVEGNERIMGRNGITFGMFFFDLGAFLSTYPAKYNKKTNFIAIICSIILLFVETTIIKKIGSTYFALQISLIACTFFIFNYLVNNKCKINNTIILRKLSILIYLIHSGIQFAYEQICKNIYSNFLWNNEFIVYICVMGITVLLSYIIIKLSEKEKFKYLKYLY